MKGSREQADIEELGQFLADSPHLIAAAHELKAPLALIRQLSLGLEAEGVESDETRRILEQISLTSQRALRLTTDLTRASRVDNTSLFELEPINPLHLCEEVVGELAPLYKARGREIRVARRQRSHLAVANRDLLRRILLNFGDNALNYAATKQPVELKVASLARGKKIRLSVRDYGPALSANVWRQLQVNLGRGPQSINARPQSSGLGLYIANQFADSMQAQVGAIRHRDGATFYVDMDSSLQLSLL